METVAIVSGHRAYRNLGSPDCASPCSRRPGPIVSMPSASRGVFHSWPVKNTQLVGSQKEKTQRHFLPIPRGVVFQDGQ